MLPLLPLIRWMGRPDAGADGAPLKIMAAAKTNIVFSQLPPPRYP